MEEFLWSQWESIDFGFDRPIYLVGKQQRLSDGTSDRVDLLAKGRSGEKIAIELKIVEAQPGDYTQLTSYMGNLESSGVPADKVRGVLLAPAFSQKVLNSAAIEPRITSSGSTEDLKEHHTGAAHPCGVTDSGGSPSSK